MSDFWQGFEFHLKNVLRFTNLIFFTYLYYPAYFFFIILATVAILASVIVIIRFSCLFLENSWFGGAFQKQRDTFKEKRNTQEIVSTEFIDQSEIEEENEKFEQKFRYRKKNNNSIFGPSTSNLNLVRRSMLFLCISDLLVCFDFLTKL